MINPVLTVNLLNYFFYWISNLGIGYSSKAKTSLQYLKNISRERLVFPWNLKLFVECLKDVQETSFECLKDKYKWRF